MKNPYRERKWQCGMAGRPSPRRAAGPRTQPLGGAQRGLDGVVRGAGVATVLEDLQAHLRNADRTGLAQIADRVPASGRDSQPEHVFPARNVEPRRAIRAGPVGLTFDARASALGKSSSVTTSMCVPARAIPTPRNAT